MIRRPPRSTQSRSSAASDVYKRQVPVLYLRYALYLKELPEITRPLIMDFIYNTDSFYQSYLYINLITVSYTHLRAHETVLDLVCRLLLEKKKIKQYTKPTQYQKLITTYNPSDNTHYY